MSDRPTYFATANKGTITRNIIQLIMDSPIETTAIGINENGSVDFIDKNDQLIVLHPSHLASPECFANPVYWEKNYKSITRIISGLLSCHDIVFDYTESFEGKDACEIRKIESYNRTRNDFQFHRGAVSVDGFVFSDSNSLKNQIGDWLKGGTNRTSFHITDSVESEQLGKYDQRISTFRLMVNGETVRILKEISTAPIRFFDFQRRLEWYEDDSAYYAYMLTFDYVTK